MRITAEEKSATRQRILQAAVELFRARGFDATTTRDIAGAAEIATGTLFNYFATKEAIVGSLAEEALVRARANFARRNGARDLEENLFTLVASELRQLKPLRKFIAPLLETSLSPLSTARRPEAAESLRIEHLEIVVQLARGDGIAELSPLAMQVYWTLYMGVLAFWADDKSPKQEDTLALLDQSLAMFVAWLNGGQGGNN
ncbi:MAG TPA: TetR/AcrR family transcriptional regulator [Pirellulales bacterium]|jgi:AcrR family transcriptional regulator|nr:TetR/AcrR family transcriptional regulator [Pirellulales bacterium]